jgi:hypothetical protein
MRLGCKPPDQAIPNLAFRPENVWTSNSTGEAGHQGIRTRGVQAHLTTGGLLAHFIGVRAQGEP